MVRKGEMVEREQRQQWWERKRKRKFFFKAAVLAFLLQGCSYSSKFTCPDSRGANCVSLSRVDQMIDSGEIEKYYEKGKDKGCLFGNCSKGGDFAYNHPPLASHEVIKGKIVRQEQQLEYTEGEDFYVK